MTAVPASQPIGSLGLGGLASPIERRYEPSWATVVFIITTVFLAIGAINSQNNLLFWAFGVSVGGLIVSGLASGAALMGVRLERTVPGVVRAGEPVSIRYRVGNESRWTPALGLVITEVNAGVPIQTGLGHVGPGRTATVAAVFTPARRGVLSLGRVTVTSSAPFGLLRKTLVFEAADVIAIGPRRLPLRVGAARPSGRLVGSHRSDRRRVGSGEELFGLREYRAGDAPRTIAWRSSARHGQLVVRQMMPPSPPRCVVRLLPIDADVGDVLAERTVALAAAAVEAAADDGMMVALDAGWAGASASFRAGDAAVRGAVRVLAGLDIRGRTTGHRVNTEAFANSDALVIAATQPESRQGPGDSVLAADRPVSWLMKDQVIESFDVADETPVRAGAVVRAGRTVGAGVRRVSSRLASGLIGPRGNAPGTGAGSGAGP